MMKKERMEHQVLILEEKKQKLSQRKEVLEHFLTEVEKELDSVNRKIAYWNRHIEKKEESEEEL